MSQNIIKLKDSNTSTEYYLIWSTIVDAPITDGMSLDELKTWYKRRHGTQGMKDLPERLSRVEKTGTSSRVESLADLISVNRAGKNQGEISLEEIINIYCLNKTQ